MAESAQRDAVQRTWRREAVLALGLRVCAAMLASSVLTRLSLGVSVWPRMHGDEALDALGVWAQVLRLGWLEVVAAAAVGLGATLLALLVVGGAATPAARQVRLLPWLAAMPLLAIGMVRRAHIDLVAAQRVGLDFDGLRDALVSGEAWIAARDASMWPLLAAAAPMWLFALGFALPPRPRGVGLGMSLGFAALLLVPAPLGVTAVDPEWPDDACWPGEVWLARTAFWGAADPGLAAGDGGDVADAAPDLPADLAAETSETEGSASDVAGRGARGGAADSALDCGPVPPDNLRGPWNVVWIIMESTGLRYVEGATFSGRRPMPFLDLLASQGWKLADHRSPSNSSATSIQAQMTGLYPMPTTQMFAVAPDNHLLALPALLPGHDRFLVTPGKLSYFFPRALLEHSGMRDLVGFHELPFAEMRADDGLAKDEIRTVDAFLQRLRRAREPFFGVYYSYVPHWEYTDYGSEWRRFRGPRLIDRYHNGLALLDAQIERIHRQLQQDGLLDRTILVLAGDHGEAFGQHERNWAHSKASFEENLQTPAVLWQPHIFAPRVVRTPTCHVDLLPTVLEAMALPPPQTPIQGESLWRRGVQREVTFHWGNEGTITALRHRDRLKLQVSIKEKSCRIFSLTRDPDERHPRSCAGHDGLRQLAWSYVHQQRVLLPAMSAARSLLQAWRVVP